MSLRANSLLEHIRDLTVCPDCTDADDQARRGAVGRQVLQALEEIDRVAQATTDAAGAPPPPATAALAGQGLAFPGSVYGVTDMCGMTVLNTARLIGSATSVRLTGRQARRA